MKRIHPGGQSQCRFLRAAFFVAALTLGAISPLRADTYQFIVSGYPATNESYPAASAGTALATTTRSGGSAASSLEARFRTWLESLGIALKSTRFYGLYIDIR